VSHRVSEIGVRLALGATTNRVVADLVGETVRVAVAGASVGWGMTLLVAAHLVRSGVTAGVFVGVPAAILGVATVACWLPARRASGVDPIAALRSD